MGHARTLRRSARARDLLLCGAFLSANRIGRRTVAAGADKRFASRGSVRVGTLRCFVARRGAVTGRARRSGGRRASRGSAAVAGPVVPVR